MAMIQQESAVRERSGERGQGVAEFDGPVVGATLSELVVVAVEIPPA
jgi:hypothetical protein